MLFSMFKKLLTRLGLMKKERKEETNKVLNGVYKVKEAANNLNKARTPKEVENAAKQLGNAAKNVVNGAKNVANVAEKEGNLEKKMNKVVNGNGNNKPKKSNNNKPKKSNNNK